MLEILEERVVLYAADAIFAPGTPMEVVQQWEDLMSQSAASGAFVPAAFRLSNRWSSTATQAGPLVQGTPTTVTWSVVPDGTNIIGAEGASPSVLRAFMDGIYGSAATPLASKPWVQLIDQVFTRWSQLSGNTYVFEPADDGQPITNQSIIPGILGTRGDVRIGGHGIDGVSNILAYNYFPNHSDMVIDTQDGAFFSNQASNSLAVRNVLAHEHGHGMGFDHLDSSNAAFLMEPFVNLGFDGPQLDDILAVQRFYGDALEKNGGNDTSATATNLGTINTGQTVSRGTLGNNTVVAATDVDFISIDDASDTDFFRFTVTAAGNVTVTLTPQGATYMEGPQNGTQNPFNTKTLSDLSFQIIASDGVTVLGTANAQPAGGTETLSGINLPAAGNYYVRVTGSATNVQLYQLDVQVGSAPAGPGIVITQTGASTDVAEGGATDTYTVNLNTAPTANVTVTLAPGTQVTVAPITLTFTPANFSNPQNVTVTAVDDALVEGPHTGTVLHTAASTDANYSGKTASLVVNISDNDGPSFVPQLRGFAPLRWRVQSGGQYAGNLTITNTSSAAAAGPLFAVLRNLPTNVTVVAPKGFTTVKHAPYFNVAALSGMAGKAKLSIPIILQNNSNAELGTYYLPEFTIQVTSRLDDFGVADPSGYVYVDANKNGARDPGEAGLADVPVELTGTTSDGQKVHDSARTDANGFYNFIVLPGTYTVMETQPAAYRDGRESLGSLGGNVENDRFTDIVVRAGDNGINYNFGEWINHAPALSSISNLLLHAGPGAATAFALAANDSDGDSLVYSAQLTGDDGLTAQAYQWKQELGLTFTGNYTIDKLRGGYHEKWLRGGKKSYLLLPDGQFFLYVKRGALNNQKYLGKLSEAYYNDASLVWDAQAPVARVQVVGNLLSITPRPGFTGTFSVSATAHDGIAGDTKTFQVTLTNAAPQLAAIGSQTTHTSLTLGLPASDADNDGLIYTAHLADRSDLAYDLKQSLGLIVSKKYAINVLRHDYQEKVVSGRGHKYLLLPDGRLYLWNGRRTPLSEQTYLATLNADYYLNPNLVTNPVEPIARLTLSGSSLTVTPRAGYTGTFGIDASASDACATAMQTFAVTATNAAPTIAAIGDQSMTAGALAAAGSGQSSLAIDLGTADADGDTLTFKATLVSGDALAFELKQALGIRATTNYTIDRLGFGYQEKWLRGTLGWYFILPNGEVYRYSGQRAPLSGHQLVGVLNGSFYDDPGLFWGASEPTIALEIVGTQLIITPRAGYSGHFTVEVRVSDGFTSASRSFGITVA